MINQQKILLSEITADYYWLNPPIGSPWNVRDVHIDSKTGKVTIYGSCTKSLGGDWNQILEPDEAAFVVLKKNVKCPEVTELYLGLSEVLDHLNQVADYIWVTDDDVDISDVASSCMVSGMNECRSELPKNDEIIGAWRDRTTGKVSTIQWIEGVDELGIVTL